MRSRNVAPTPAGLSPSELGEVSRAAEPDPDLLGRELDTAPTTVAVPEGSPERPPGEAESAAFADRLAGADGTPPFLDGVGMEVEVFRGWTPASPIYTVTRAEGSVLYEIDGQPATDWYRHFFTVGGELAPLPEASQGFPLIIAGPSPRRQNLYRSLRAFDQPEGAVTLWGGIETGDQVRMGMFGGEDRESAFGTLEASTGRLNRFEGEILRNLLLQTTSAYDDQLGAIAAEKEIAQVTLASIGDGVLSTDARGRVELLNPVAEELAGWSAGEAAGLPAAEVLRLVDEGTGREIEHPVERCLASGLSLRLTERIALQRRDGRRHAVECTCSPIRDRQGAQVGAVLVFQDVTEKRLLALQLAHQATHDGLTGLFNRAAFDGHLQRALEETRRTGVPHALAYMDLDQFKLVNDTCGHLAGDELLHRVTEMLQTAMRASDIVARLGGDEFGWLSLYSPLETAERQLAKFHRELQGFRFAWQDKSFTVGVSIGLVPITEDFASVAHLLSAADHACYVAKEKGRNRIQVYRPDTAEFVRRDADMNWVLRIQETLERDRFRLFAQEIRPLHPREGGGLRFEVLLRMIAEGGQIHLPSDFIRAAERYGLMRSIDRWVIGRSLETFAAESPAWLEGLGLCAINLSAVSIGDETFLDFVEDRLAATGFPAGKLCFEITETAAIENLQQAVRLLGRLGARGVRFALDDFGSGMASYAYLKELPVSFLKIDGKFIQDIVTDPLDRAMVESINQVGHVMGLETIAESVGSLAAVNQLRALGVDYGQGHWISPPRPLSALREIASAS